MKIRIEYFALLKDQRGQDQEVLETSATTPAALYEELRTAHNFTLPKTNLKVAINEDFADWDTPLEENDTLVFIPPVAGG
ncbi:MAG: MoaD/ThiS family protein [Verrucomicrobiota bacterium]